MKRPPDLTGSRLIAVGCVLNGPLGPFGLLFLPARGAEPIARAFSLVHRNHPRRNGRESTKLGDFTCELNPWEAGLDGFRSHSERWNQGSGMKSSMRSIQNGLGITKSSVHSLSGTPLISPR